MKKNQGQEIIEIPINAKEEKFFQWIESDKVKNSLSESEIASKLNLDRNSAARLLRGYVENFSLDSLINYVEKLHLPLQVKVSETSGLGSSF